jgi:hypothetical protein
MACKPFSGKLADGTPFGGFICGPRTKMKKCTYCSRPHTKLCDFKTEIEGGWKVCDKPMCDACSEKKGDDIDHCRIHAIRGDKGV